MTPKIIFFCLKIIDKTLKILDPPKIQFIKFDTIIQNFYDYKTALNLCQGETIKLWLLIGRKLEIPQVQIIETEVFTFKHKKLNLPVMNLILLD